MLDLLGGAAITTFNMDMFAWPALASIEKDGEEDDNTNDDNTSDTTATNDDTTATISPPGCEDAVDGMPPGYNCDIPKAFL
mmetsp:Transcript_6382/g.16329  ORF Transcript_6382/g.16329 Transcript_6382/m.16329 type:complete len:81 (+) Transcript_6382:93-335(+)